MWYNPILCEEVRGLCGETYENIEAHMWRSKWM